MKTRNAIIFVLSFLFSLIYFFACSEGGPTKTEEKVKFSANQIPGCFGSASEKRASAIDSCFIYSFNDTLKIDFCVYGNCCPDSNRFETTFNISSDTIYVAVADTAERLCRCFCNYTIQLELSGLENDRYLFYCNFDETMIYREFIDRNN